MIYIKNLQSTSFFKGFNSYNKIFHNFPDSLYLRILRSIVYVLIYKKEQEQKSEKFVSQILKDQLIGFDSHIIYKVHIEEQKQVIRVKDL